MERRGIQMERGEMQAKAAEAKQLRQREEVERQRQWQKDEERERMEARELFTQYIRGPCRGE